MKVVTSRQKLPGRGRQTGTGRQASRYEGRGRQTGRGRKAVAGTHTETGRQAG
jgi:hypothetical protein